MNNLAAATEFARQVQNLLDQGYPQLARMPERIFLGLLSPLRRQLHKIAADRTRKNRIPFVIVIKTELVPADAAMGKVRVKGKRGHVDMRPVTPDCFAPIPEIILPKSPAYLLLDVDTGQKTLNHTTVRALKNIRRQRRSPLVIDEGLALLTHFPEVLIDKQRYNCFWLSGSRGKDQRVPAMWISYGRPRLGWCWENTPHTWLGSASCGGRIGSGRR